MAPRAGYRMSRRTVGMTMAALAGSVVAAACGPVGGGGGGTSDVGQTATKWEGQQQIDIWVTGYEPVVEAYKTLVTQFEEENPTIKVSNQAQKYLRTRDLVPALAGGLPPAVGEINQPGTWTYAGAGLVAPLDNFIKRDKPTADAVANDFYPGILESVTWRNELHFFLVGVSMEVWHINKDFWNRAGLSLPTSGWTWDDLAGPIGDGLKSAVGEDGSPFMCELNEMYRMMHFVLQNGGDMVDESGTKLTISTPEFIGAVEYVRKLVLAEVLREKNPKKAEAGPVRGGRENMIGAKYTHGENYRSSRGDVAMELEGMTRIPGYRKSLGDLMGVVPAITGKEQKALFDSWTLGLVKQEDEAQMEAGYQFMAWFVRPENLLTYLKARANLPPRKAIAALPNAGDLWAAEPLVRDALEYLDYGKTFPFTPATSQLRIGINSVLANITRYGDPAAQTLTELEKVLNAQYGFLLQ